MAIYSGDRKIQLLGVYKVLLGTSSKKPISTTGILEELDKKYNIKISFVTLSDDMACIAAVEPNLRKKVRYKGGDNIYWIERSGKNVRCK